MNIVFDSLLETLEKSRGIKPRGYEDDGMFLIFGICPNNLFDLAQPAIDCAIEWGKDNGPYTLDVKFAQNVKKLLPTLTTILKWGRKTRKKGPSD